MVDGCRWPLFCDDETIRAYLAANPGKKCDFADHTYQRKVRVRMMMNNRVKLYRNRAEAGTELATKLAAYRSLPGVIMLALPRGGVAVAVEMAAYLQVPMDIFLVRKLGVPGQPELAMGAIASGGIRVLNDHIVKTLGISATAIERVAEQELAELKRREELYRRGPAPDLAGKVVILVDDGLATGATMRAAIEAVRSCKPGKIIVAVPVAAPDTAADMAPEVDEFVCPRQPQPFFGVGAWYEEFPQMTDAQVCALLALST